jgi:hypothetical protein
MLEVYLNPIGDFTDHLNILKILTSYSISKIDRGGRGHFPLLDLYTFSVLQSGRGGSQEEISWFSSDTSYQIHATKALHAAPYRHLFDMNLLNSGDAVSTTFELKPE